MVIKIQSVSDVITNSSTEVFIVYNLSNIDSIKELVNAILAIDGNYTFDDLFNIEMQISEDFAWSMVDEWEYYFEEKCPYENWKGFYEHLCTLSKQELDEYEQMSESPRSIYKGYSVSLKDGIENSDKLQKAIKAIQSIDSIFSIDYTSN